MNRCLSVVLAATLVVALASAAQAEQGMPSQATLRAMGLSSMQVISDFDAMSIRGMGYHKSNSKVVAFGVSYAKVKGQGAEAGSIDAIYTEGKHSASTAHGSIAGKIVITSSGKKGGGGGGGGGGAGGAYSAPTPSFTNGTNGNSGGHGGGKVQVKATIVFAGGFAVGHAY